MKDISFYLELAHKMHYERTYQSSLENFNLNDMQILDSCINYYIENIDRHYNFQQIFESHSIFNKCRDITKFITFVLNNFDVKEASILFICDEIEEIKNDYVRTITVNFDSIVKNNAEYELDKNITLNNDKLDYIIININSNLLKDQIYDKVEHELTHSFEDYNRVKNNTDNLFIKSIKDKYHKLILLDIDSKELKDVKNLLYLLDRSEQNAYIAQFDGILGDNEYITIQQAYDTLYNSKLYQDIKSFSYLVTNKDKETQELLCNLYRKIYESKETNNKILKKIYKEWDRFFEHFRRNIYQCVCDHIKYNHSMDHGNFLGNNINNSKEKLKEKIEKEYINKSIFIEK